jgi:hypothetical protein
MADAEKNGWKRRRRPKDSQAVRGFTRGYLGAAFAELLSVAGTCSGCAQVHIVFNRTGVLPEPKKGKKKGPAARPPNAATGPETTRSGVKLGETA